MTSYELDERARHPIVYPLARCPACKSARLEPVVEDVVQEVHFLCRDCDRCWNVEMGHVQRVAPSACLGCSARPRCERAYMADDDAAS